MAKENEKKVSGDMSPEELENVAGGWCMTGGKSVPPEVTSVQKETFHDGTYKIVTTFSNGSQVHSMFDADGNLEQSADARPFPRK